MKEEKQFTNSKKEKSAWQKWIESEEGKSSSDMSTLTDAKYLENRLWRAFRAGQESSQTTKK